MNTKDDSVSREATCLLSVRNLRIGFPATGAILPPISFDLRASQVTSIVGHNGSGKSTLLKTLLGLQPALTGEISTPAGLRLGYVPQREAMDPIYPIHVEQLIETGRYGIRGLGRKLVPEDREKIREVMRSTGVLPLARRLFRTCSGGEQQRALLARALCTAPNVLILDEPTASMDERGANEVMALTINLAKRQGAAVLMVNHFIDLVLEISDQVILLDRDHQRTHVGAPTEVLKDRGAIYGG